MGIKEGEDEEEETGGGGGGGGGGDDSPEGSKQFNLGLLICKMTTIRFLFELSR